MTVVTLGIVLLICSILYLARLQREAETRVLLLLTFVLVALTVVPRNLVVLGEGSPGHAGISASSPLIASYTVAVGIAYLMLFGRGRTRIAIPHRILLAVLPLMIVFVWGSSAERWSGYLHLTVAVLAWGVGYAVSRSLRIDGSGSTVWAMLISAILLLQLAVAALQILGVEVPSVVSGVHQLVNERTVGTLANAANLSKIVFYLLILLLPLSTSALPKTRSWALVGVLAGVVTTGLTVSRANMVAIGAMLVIWGLFVPGRIKIPQRAMIIVAIIGGAWFFAGDFIARFLADGKDPRAQLLETALQFLPDYFWNGLGVNSYVPTIGMFDSATAAGFPVHNAFLLVLIEMGIFVAVLFFLPLVFLLLRGFQAAAKGRAGNIFAWAFLASVPGHIAIMTTGWGVLGGFALPAFFFVLGIVDRQTQPRPPSLAVSDPVLSAPLLKSA